MDPPEGLEDCRFGELYLCLPPDWPLSLRMRQNDPAAWPLRLLTGLAQYPHQSGRWLWFCHTWSEEPAEAFADDVGFTAVMLGPPISLPEGFNGVPIDPGRTVWYFSVLPLYPEELAQARRLAAHMELRWLLKSGVTDLVDVGRRNIAAWGRR